MGLLELQHLTLAVDDSLPVALLLAPAHALQAGATICATCMRSCLLQNLDIICYEIAVIGLSIVVYALAVLMICSALPCGAA